MPTLRMIRYLLGWTIVLRLFVWEGSAKEEKRGGEYDGGIVREPTKIDAAQSAQLLTTGTGRRGLDLKSKRYTYIGYVRQLSP